MRATAISATWARSLSVTNMPKFYVVSPWNVWSSDGSKLEPGWKKRGIELRLLFIALIIEWSR